MPSTPPGCLVDFSPPSCRLGTEVPHWVGLSPGLSQPGGLAMSGGCGEGGRERGRGRKKHRDGETDKGTQRQRGRERDGERRQLEEGREGGRQTDKKERGRESEGERDKKRDGGGRWERQGRRGRRGRGRRKEDAESQWGREGPFLQQELRGDILAICQNLFGESRCPSHTQGEGGAPRRQGAPGTFQRQPPRAPGPRLPGMCSAWQLRSEKPGSCPAPQYPLLPMYQTESGLEGAERGREQGGGALRGP